LIAPNYFFIAINKLIKDGLSTQARVVRIEYWLLWVNRDASRDFQII